LKHTKETQHTPELHMNLLQREIEIYIESNVKTIRELFGDAKEEEYLKRWNENYKTLAAIKGSILMDGEEANGNV